MVEKYRQLNKNGKYPRKLYLQLDGGAENANKYVLSMLEILVGKRVCQNILYSRLPTGHTHEDIGKQKHTYCYKLFTNILLNYFYFRCLL